MVIAVAVVDSFHSGVVHCGVDLFHDHDVTKVEAKSRVRTPNEGRKWLTYATVVSRELFVASLVTV